MEVTRNHWLDSFGGKVGEWEGWRGILGFIIGG